MYVEMHCNQSALGNFNDLWIYGQVYHGANDLLSRRENDLSSTRFNSKIIQKEQWQSIWHFICIIDYIQISISHSDFVSILYCTSYHFQTWILLRRRKRISPSYSTHNWSVESLEFQGMNSECNVIPAGNHASDCKALLTRSRIERGGKRGRRRYIKNKQTRGQASLTVSLPYPLSRWEHGVLAVLLLINTA